MTVVTQLLGGLGNQMFQYAAGRAVAHRLGVPLKLDLSRFEDYKLRSYKLNHFHIQENIATQEDLNSFTNQKQNLIERLASKFRIITTPWHLQNVIQERQFGYDADVKRIENSCLMKGYWQSEKYFKNIEQIIRKEFQVKGIPDSRNSETLSEIRATPSVNVHVRRGDFVQNPVTKKVHGFLGLSYYEKAIKYLESRIEKPVFFVFSDDIEWAKNNIKAKSLIHFIDHNDENKDYEDLRLMMNCKYHIIANSSFSWWGAWLSTFREKQVIAPKQWFTKNEMKRKGQIDIVPGRWKTL